MFSTNTWLGIVLVSFVIVLTVMGVHFVSLSIVCLVAEGAVLIFGVSKLWMAQRVKGEQGQ